MRTVDRQEVPLPITAVMITLNEAHNMAEVLKNLRGFAADVVVVDSFSSDATVDLALAHGARVVQRRFRDFGDQWNYALRETGITTPWTMKVDPDERLSPELKRSIAEALEGADVQGFTVTRKLWFMGRPLPITQVILRVWRTGACRFSDVLVNEYPMVAGRIEHLKGVLEHRDSPSLHHWFDKQNKYGTAEAVAAFEGHALSFSPRLFGSPLERRMWLKKRFHQAPMRYAGLFLYNYFVLGAWRAGRAGLVWARLRSDIMRFIEYKVLEMRLLGSVPPSVGSGNGPPDSRVPQADLGERLTTNINAQPTNLRAVIASANQPSSESSSAGSV